MDGQTRLDRSPFLIKDLSFEALQFSISCVYSATRRTIRSVLSLIGPEMLQIQLKQFCPAHISPMIFNRY
ncbi:hypothetical protein L596_006907 [Steinernema carpocapsae]|uniref:Uncharacterized protein n=1 Tax=Steinernema carpocapsae TaxID=34508 RepID=A0A4U5P7E0_STECR|nr:hypothetical protein L596_006907 [Steinernema carpocapsae]